MCHMHRGLGDVYQEPISNKIFDRNLHIKAPSSHSYNSKNSGWNSQKLSKRAKRKLMSDSNQVIIETWSDVFWPVGRSEWPNLLTLDSFWCRSCDRARTLMKLSSWHFDKCLELPCATLLCCALFFFCGWAEHVKLRVSFCNEKTALSKSASKESCHVAGAVQLLAITERC